MPDQSFTTVDMVVGAVAAGHETKSSIAGAIGVPEDHHGLERALTAAVSDYRLRYQIHRDGVTHYTVAPTGTIDMAALEMLRAQKMRRMISAGNSIIGDLQLAVGRAHDGGAAHSSTFSNLAGRLSDLAAVAASIELIDSLAPNN